MQVSSDNSHTQANKRYHEDDPYVGRKTDMERHVIGSHGPEALAEYQTFVIKNQVATKSMTAFFGRSMKKQRTMTLVPQQLQAQVELPYQVQVKVVLRIQVFLLMPFTS